MPHLSETETVIKRIVPYLQRRGYDLDSDLTFEDPVQLAETDRAGFVDILVHCSRANPVFLIEAKRDGTAIRAAHRKQALSYGTNKKVLLVAITNGTVFELLNVTTGKPLTINGSPINRIPCRSDLLGKVLKQLKADKTTSDLQLPDGSLPFRPGLPLTKLNHLIKTCHNTIRKIEKNEEHAFSDFSKFLFLKLLEEKWDEEGVAPPYTYTFHELALKPDGQADQVQTAIRSMIQTIRDNTPYGDVLSDTIHLKQARTYKKIVAALAAVSLSDCNLDSKGAAFEYFVRATLKGKKLGQYFTPRPLVALMLELARWQQIAESLRAGQDFKVLDLACGTGGFLVLAMNKCLRFIDEEHKAKKIHASLATHYGVKSSLTYSMG